MGTWSHEAFGNDMACDWAAELAESNDFSVIDAAFDQVIEERDSDFIDADVGSAAHAAAEVLAQVLGDGTTEIDFLEDVMTWLENNSEKPSSELLNKALLALGMLSQENSELNELWQDSEEYEEWVQNINDLKEILRSKI